MIEVIVLDDELYSDYDLQPKTFGSAGLDLKLTRDAKPAAQIAAEGGVWPYYDLIGTGLKVRVPTNMVGLIVPRSSAGHKSGFQLGNTIGVIDSDYRGELMLSIGGGDYGKLKRGAAMAQLILVPYSSFFGAKRVTEFSDADTAYGKNCRGEGGYGSTDETFMVNTRIALAQPWCPEFQCTDNLLVQDHCPGKGCADKGCPVHHTVAVPSISEVERVLLQSREWAELSPTQRGNCGDARHEAGCQLADEYNALSKLNGGF